MKQYIAIEEILDTHEQDKKAESDKTQQTELPTQEQDLQARLNINRTEILKGKNEKKRDEEKKYEINIKLEKKSSLFGLSVLLKQISTLALNNDVLIKHIETTEIIEPAETHPPIEWANDPKKEIVEYAMRFLPAIAKNKKELWKQLWSRLLEQDELHKLLFKSGRGGSGFNRNGVAAVVGYVKCQYPHLFAESRNTKIAEIVENDKDHSIRKKLGPANLSPKEQEAIRQLFQNH